MWDSSLGISRRGWEGRGQSEEPRQGPYEDGTPRPECPGPAFGQWGGAGWGRRRHTTSPQWSPSHPTAIMLLSALVETEGIVCAGRGWDPRPASPSERQDCLGQPPWPGANGLHVTTNPEQVKGQLLSKDREPLRCQASRLQGARREEENRSFGKSWVIRSWGIILKNLG